MGESRYFLVICGTGLSPVPLFYQTELISKKQDQAQSLKEAEIHLQNLQPFPESCVK